MLSRKNRLLIVGAIITIGLIGVIIIEAPEPTRTVDEVMESPSKYVDQEISIRGEVLDGSIDNSTMTFILHGSNYNITVEYIDASVSNGLDDNRTVYAQGILTFSDGKYLFEADIIKTSCPSKYEE
ncbi:MAG: cytochrome c maturation protein CcmE [Candidatus Poseidoniales archaeon]|nr:MAG: cytochrome c maturation protein CcmE [Candidatus Poseidoniales archaeon]